MSIEEILKAKSVRKLTSEVLKDQVMPKWQRRLKRALQESTCLRREDRGLTRFGHDKSFEGTR